MDKKFNRFVKTQRKVIIGIVKLIYLRDIGILGY